MLKIISGKYQGKKLNSLTENNIRPSKSIVREALFNILQHNVLPNYIGKTLAEINMVDLCCGAGTIGIEAISRGIKSALFIDNNKLHLDIVRQNLNLLQIKQATLLQADIYKLPIAKNNYDFIFIDPPYKLLSCIEIQKNLINKNWLSSNTVITIEMDSSQNLDIDKYFKIISIKKYGKSKLVFLC